MLSQNRLLRRLARKEVWGWPLAIFALVLFSVLSIFTDLLLAPTIDIRWLYINFLTYVEVIILGSIFSFGLIRRIENSPLRFWVNLFISAILGAAKNVSVGFLTVWFGLPENATWQTRLFGGALMGLGILVFFSSVLGSRVEHVAALSQLAQAKSALLNHRSTAEKLVDAEKSRLLRDTRASLLPKLEKIQGMISSREDSSKAIDQLRNLIENQIRPMSKELSERAAALSSNQSSFTRLPKFFVKTFVWPETLMPTGVIVVLLSMSWMFVQIFFGVELAWVGTVMAAITSTFLLVLKMILPRKTRIGRQKVLILSPLLATFLSLPGFFVGYWLVGESTYRLSLLSHFVLVFILVWGSTYVEVLDLDRKVSEQEARRDLEELKRELTLFDQQLWLARRSWGMVLHGTVQAALTAAIARLSSGQLTEKYQFELVSQDLDRARKALESAPEPEVNFDKISNELVRTWAGICEVTWRVSERAQRVIQRDSSVLICINEIAKEAVSNAVRHGNASTVRIEVERSHDELIEIKAVNNGTAPKSKSEQGLGSKLLDDLTLEWKLSYDRASGKTILSATFPISVINLSPLSLKSG